MTMRVTMTPVRTVRFLRLAIGFEIGDRGGRAARVLLRELVVAEAFLATRR